MSHRRNPKRNLKKYLDKNENRDTTFPTLGRRVPGDTAHGG